MKKSIALITILFILLLTACAAPEPNSYPEGSIAAHLAADGRFNTFLEISDEVVHDSGPPLLTKSDRAYTIFAPTDEAFDALPSELVEQLKEDPSLAEIFLFHHGFDKPVQSKDFGLLNTWPTIWTPTSISFEIDGEVIRYDGAQVIEKDILVGDSVIHVLGEVVKQDLWTD